MPFYDIMDFLLQSAKKTRAAAAARTTAATARSSAATPPGESARAGSPVSSLTSGSFVHAGGSGGGSVGTRSTRARMVADLGAALGDVAVASGPTRGGGLLDSLRGRGSRSAAVSEEEELVFDEDARSAFGGILSPSRRTSTGSGPDSVRRVRLMDVREEGDPEETVGGVPGDTADEDLLDLVEVLPSEVCGGAIGKGVGDLLKACAEAPLPGESRCKKKAHETSIVEERGYVPRNTRNQLMMAGFMPYDKARAFPHFDTVAATRKPLSEWVSVSQMVREGHVRQADDEGESAFLRRVELAASARKAPGGIGGRVLELDEEEEDQLDWTPETGDAGTRLLGLEDHVTFVSAKVAQLFGGHAESVGGLEAAVAALRNDVGIPSEVTLEMGSTGFECVAALRAGLDWANETARKAKLTSFSAEASAESAAEALRKR